MNYPVTELRGIWVKQLTVMSFRKLGLFCEGCRKLASAASRELF